MTGLSFRDQVLIEALLPKFLSVIGHLDADARVPLSVLSTSWRHWAIEAGLPQGLRVLSARILRAACLSGIQGCPGLRVIHAAESEGKRLRVLQGFKFTGF